MGVFGQTTPNLDVALIHSAGRQSGGIEEIRRESALAKFFRQPQPFVNPLANRAVTAALPIRRRVGDEELSATRAISGMSRPPHAMEGQEAEKQEVNERNEQLL